MLDWFPKQIFTGNVSVDEQLEKKRKSTMRRHSVAKRASTSFGSLETSAAPYVESQSWDFSSFLKLIQSYTPSSSQHIELMECCTLIIIADVLTVVFQCYDISMHRQATGLQLDVLEDLINLIFDVFRDLPKRFTLLYLRFNHCL